MRMNPGVQIESAKKLPHTGMITSYGLHWSAQEFVSSEWELAGRHTRRRKLMADFREQNGVYVLYRPNGGLLYIGIATADSLVDRLRTHYSRDKWNGKWSRFSWFGFRKLDLDAPINGWCTMAPTRSTFEMSGVRPKDAIKDLEALLIRVQSKSAQELLVKQHRPPFRSGDEWRQMTAKDLQKWKSSRPLEPGPLEVGDRVRTLRYGPAVIIGLYGTRKFRVRTDDGKIHILRFDRMAKDSTDRPNTALKPG